ncbi:MAG: FxsA family protein [Sulfuricaulis sp.]
MPGDDEPVMLWFTQAFASSKTVLILLLLLVPIAEIATFIWVGSRIGVGLTLLLVIASAIIGFRLVRRQGFATAMRVQAMITRGESPALGMLEGFALLAAGVLLVIPGFLTDIAAFILLIPPLRRGIMRLYLRQTRSGASVAHQHPSTAEPKCEPLEGKSRRVD